MITAVAVLALTSGSSLRAQTPGERPLASVERIQCRFSLMVVGTWDEDAPEVESRSAALVLEFENVNADEGSAQLASGFGVYDIIVRYAEGYLHFIQSFLDGPLHVTTILETETADGRFRAMHSRHEYTDFALPGFTSSPEQYYGDCQVPD